MESPAQTRAVLAVGCIYIAAHEASAPFLLHWSSCMAVLQSPSSYHPLLGTCSPEGKVNLQLVPTLGDQPRSPISASCCHLSPSMCYPFSSTSALNSLGTGCVLCFCWANQTHLGRSFIMHASSLCNFQVSPEVTMALRRLEEVRNAEKSCGPGLAPQYCRSWGAGAHST